MCNRYFKMILFVCFAFHFFGILPQSTYAQDDKGLLDWVYDQAPSDSHYIFSIENLCLDLLHNAWASANKIREVIHHEGRAIAKSLLLPILTAEITFTGVRMMLKASVVEQLGRLTLTTFLLTILLWQNGPTDIIANGMRQLTLAGKGIGKKILVAAVDPKVCQQLPSTKSKFGWEQIKNANPVPAYQKHLANIEDLTKYNPEQGLDVGAKELEPIYYWTAWIGLPPTRDEIKASSDAMSNLSYKVSGDSTRFYKFSMTGLMLRIWGDSKFSSSTGESSKDKSMDVISQIILATVPFQQFASALIIASVQISAILAPAIAMVSILVGSIFSFHVVYALGIATLPLIYFKSFDRLWAKYLNLLVGLALIPFFYYIFSAIGFVFAVNLFEMLFPLDPQASSTSLGQLINSVFMDSIYSVLSSGSFYFKIGVVQQGIGAIYSLGQGFVVLGKIITGSVVVASFIFGGTSFAAMAPTVAMHWNMGFGGHEVMGKISDFFRGLGNTMSGAAGHVVGEQVNQGSGLLNTIKDKYTSFRG